MKALSKSYPTNLTERQWQLLKPLIPPAKAGGRPRRVDLRAVLNAIFYLLVSGCAWSLLPGDFPPSKTVYHYFRQWRIEGVWQRLNDRLRRMVRVKAGRHPSPSAAILDSQTRRLSTMLAQAVGYDGAKHINGRKLHLLVDTLGLVMVAVVTAASVSERDGARLVFATIRGRFPRLLWIWVDGGYAGAEFVGWVMQTYHWIVRVVRRPQQTRGFVKLPVRWRVERTFGWLNWCRRFSKDYEVLPETHEAMVYAAMVRLMVRRLA
jgi:transposase